MARVVTARASGGWDPEYPVDFAFRREWTPLQALLGAASEQAIRQLRRVREAALCLRKDAKWDDPVARFAPSVVIRSENELLGASGPRFAIRVYLTADRGSFVNLRRVEELQARIVGTPLIAVNAHDLDPARYLPVAPPGSVDEAVRRLEAKKVMHVADALLVPHTDLTDQFHVLTVDLGREYGEGRPIIGTPYCAPLSGIGGGKCAQAAVFVASALLLGMPEQRPDEWWSNTPNPATVTEIASAPATAATAAATATAASNATELALATEPPSRVCVHGPGEVTAIVARAQSLRTLRLRGLRTSDIRAYFEATCRRCLVQGNIRFREFMGGRQETLNCFEAVLRAYLRSGVPIIFPVDSKRLGKPPPQGQPPETDHSVVIVGYNKTAEIGSFVVNDPNRPPFAKHDTQHLWDASDSDASIEAGGIGRTICVPLPRRVRFSVETLSEIRHHRGARWNRSRPGLIDLALLLQLHNTFNAGSPCSYTRHAIDEGFDLGEMSLARFALPGRPSGFETVRRSDLLDNDDGNDATLRELWAEVEAQWPDRWCYLQYRCGRPGAERKSLWIWDAEAICVTHPWFDPERDDVDPRRLVATAERQVVAIFEKASAEQPWRRLEHANEMPVDAKATAALAALAHTAARETRHACIPANCQLDFAVITSISPNSAKAAIRQIAKRSRPDRLPQIDLFSFMQRDPLLRRPPFAALAAAHPGGQPPARPPMRTVQVMAAACDRIDLIEALAGKISRACRRKASSLPELRIGALATFLPDITMAEAARREQGIRAAVFCLRLADCLRRRFAHPVAAVELVCGSRLKGLAAATDMARNERVYFAVARGEREIVDTVRESLLEIVARAKPARNDAGVALIPLAVELEPGPLNAINHRNILLNLSKSVEGTPAWGVVGLNLDAAHFHLAGTEPAHLEAGEFRKYVRDRIVHAHVSDHGLGVFGDVSLAREYAVDDRTGAAWLKPWARFLNTLSAERGPRAASLRRQDALPYSGLVSLELEAVRSLKMVAESHDEFLRWFRT